MLVGVGGGKRYNGVWCIILVGRVVLAKQRIKLTMLFLALFNNDLADVIIEHVSVKQ